MRFSNIITTSAIAVIGWMIFITATANYIKLDTNGQPRVNIGDLQTSLTPKERKLPIGLVAKNRGWDLSLPFATEAEYEELLLERERKKLVSLFVAFVVGSFLFFVVYLFSDSWFVALSCLIIGPICLTMTSFYELSFSLGGEALRHAEETNSDLQADWMAIILQFCFGAPLGMVIVYIIGDSFSYRPIYLTSINIPCLLLGGGFILGSAFMIHGDKLLIQDHIIPGQGIKHSRISLYVCRAVFFIGTALFVYSII